MMGRTILLQGLKQLSLDYSGNWILKCKTEKQRGWENGHLDINNIVTLVNN